MNLAKDVLKDIRSYCHNCHGAFTRCPDPCPAVLSTIADFMSVAEPHEGTKFVSRLAKH